MRLKNLMAVPVMGGWAYVQYETGRRFKEASFSELVEAVLEHRKSNDLKGATKEDVSQDVDGQICLSQPPHICSGGDFQPASLHAKDVMVAARAMIETLGSTGFEERAEAERRADICSRCPMNQPSQGCFGRCMDAMKEAFHLLIGDRETESDDKLLNCAVCGCATKTLIWFKKEALKSNLSEKQRETYKKIAICWRND